jgi:hypothetical protein
MTSQQLILYSTYSTVLHHRLLESSQHPIFILSRFAYNEKQIRRRQRRQWPTILFLSSLSLCHHHSIEGKFFVKLSVVLFCLSLPIVSGVVLPMLSLSLLCGLLSCSRLSYFYGFHIKIWLTRRRGHRMRRQHQRTK